MIKAKKSLGQNFLTDQNTCIKIVDSLEINDNDIVVEIGPGTGALTDHLIEKNIDLILIEIDERAIKILENRYFEKDNYSIIAKSIIEVNLANIADSAGKKIKVIGNIPYHLSGNIFFKIFENAEKIEKAVLTVQKEVAERVASKVNASEYGILTVAANLSGKTRKLFDIPSSAFTPAPKVTSATVEINLDPKVSRDHFTKVMKVVKTAFNQRRKMISNSLKGYLNDNIKNIDYFYENSKLWKEIKDKRPQNLDHLTYLLLFEEINKYT